MLFTKKSKVSMMSQGYTAFTLAEVLITLGIIGIVATMSIPTLMNNIGKTQYITGLKKFYSQSNQALLQLSVDYGCTNDLACTGLFASGTDHNSLGTALAKYFKVIKNCGVAQNNTTPDCWPMSTDNTYDGTGSKTNYNNTGYYKFVTTDGMSVFIDNTWRNNCNDSSLGSGKLGYMSKMCALVTVDVNGLKGPNYYGRDTFDFWITNGKGAMLYPRGGIDYINYWKDKDYCTNTNSTGSNYCGARIIEEGWKMDY